MTLNRLLALVGVLFLFTAVGVSLLPLRSGLSDTIAHAPDAAERAAGTANGRFTSALMFGEERGGQIIEPVIEAPALVVPDQELRLSGVGADLTGPLCWIAAGDGQAVPLRVGDHFQGQEVVRIGDADVVLRSDEGVTILNLFAGH